MSKILVVDDALTDRALAGGLLRKSMDCTILEAENGEDALQKIAEHHPQLVLTDLDMPGMNGLELVSAIKDDHPLIPVILMTAKGSEEIASQALQCGATSYVPKRRLSEDLTMTVKRVMHASRENRVQAQLMHYLTDDECRFVLHNDLPLIDSLVSHLLHLLRCLPLGDETERLRVGVALEEALYNAYYHGNLEVGAELTPSDRNSYDDLADRRCLELPYRERQIHVHAQISRNEARFVIRDEGGGFNRAPVDDDDDIADQTAGRGLRLMRSIMDEVTFNDCGNEVTLVKLCVQEPEYDELLDDADD